ncbi:hypothetical protein AAFC00_005851 [Neodothiora populina]|uniref:Uncharacterized protein n=1 Tax=Neodothiora populina TaxID=2781224 RepID=A0ABR3P7D9_9PEZI
MYPSFIPRHRCPSRISHRADVEAAFQRKKTPVLPPDCDKFYYDQAFISEWSMPANLWIRLPTQLIEEVRTWQFAGAAVLTALARYDKLELESLTRGWPEKVNLHLARTTPPTSPAMQSPTSTILESPLEGSFAELLPLRSDFRLRKDSAMANMTDTPPIVPQNSGVGIFTTESVAIPSSGHDHADLDQVNSRLTGLSKCYSDKKVFPPSPDATPNSRRGSAVFQVPAFDEAAWDVYINSCKAELEHLRVDILVRFRHLGRGIDRLWTDLKNDSSSDLLMGASLEFVIWWKNMTEKAQQCEEEVKGLELPNLEEVKMERAAHGLPI